MKKFILPFLLLLYTPAMSEEDFLGENTPEEEVQEQAPQEEPKYGWNDTHSQWSSKNWFVLDFMSCGIGRDFRRVQDYRAFWLSLYPLGESEYNKNQLHVSHTAYDGFELKSEVNGSISFDGGQKKKLKFFVDLLSEGIEGRYLGTTNKFDLNIVRAMTSSKTATISIDGVEDITIPLDGFTEAYDALRECYAQVKERAQE